MSGEKCFDPKNGNKVTPEDLYKGLCDLEAKQDKQREIDNQRQEKHTGNIIEQVNKRIDNAVDQISKRVDDTNKKTDGVDTKLESHRKNDKIAGAIMSIFIVLFPVSPYIYKLFKSNF